MADGDDEGLPQPLRTPTPERVVLNVNIFNDGLVEIRVADVQTPSVTAKNESAPLNEESPRVRAHPHEEPISRDTMEPAMLDPVLPLPPRRNVGVLSTAENAARVRHSTTLAVDG